jgi:hypothetical protein
MVSMLYRTHKSLQPQFKVPSLYAFDALARAARGHALKHGFTGDAQPGNSATFLLKLEAVLEGLFQDMMDSGVLEGKVSKTYAADLPIAPGSVSLVLVCSPTQTQGRFAEAVMPSMANGRCATEGHVFTLAAARHHPNLSFANLGLRTS